MKKFIQFLVRIIKVAYKILPFFIGIYCYYPVFITQENRIYPVLDCIYASMKLYTGNTESDVAVGALLQIARYMALFASFNVLMRAFDKMNDAINRIKLFDPEAIVVYGDSCYAEYIYENLNSSARIRGKEKFIDSAPRYLLMFSKDTDNLDFYDANYEELKDKNVYMMLDDISRQSIENPLISVFSIAENCARQYWRDYPIENKNEKIAIVGFDSVGKNILLFGLQVNLIDPDQRLEYHIYGDGRKFRREHTELDKMEPDKLIFHDGGIEDYAEMSEFDRIIVCRGADEGQNIETVSKLLEASPIRDKIYIYAPNGDIVTNLFGKDRIVCFGTAKEMATVDMVLNEKSMEAARKQHEFYVKQYGGTPWEKLDAFKRYSNVSSSDYMFAIERLMKKGVPMESLAELEHIRWCRYHYIHNWRYGEKRDDSRRIHPSLIPFDALSDEEKQKDVEAIKSKF